jgi:hypothetical protein
MFRFALDGMIAFSFLPLQLTARPPFFFDFLSFLYVLYEIFIKLICDQAGCIFLGGVHYFHRPVRRIGQIFMEAKGLLPGPCLSNTAPMLHGRMGL